MAKKVQFYKISGGHVTLIKVHGKWHFVGSTAEANVAMSKAADQQGVRLVRSPAPRSFPHGKSLQTVMDMFPPWKPSDGFA